MTAHPPSQSVGRFQELAEQAIHRLQEFKPQAGWGPGFGRCRFGFVDSKTPLTCGIFFFSLKIYMKQGERVGIFGGRTDDMVGHEFGKHTHVLKGVSSLNQR